MCAVPYSAPASLRTSELLPVPAPVNRSLSDSGRGDMGTGHATTSISQVDLQQALSLALSTVQVCIHTCSIS